MIAAWQLLLHGDPETYHAIWVTFFTSTLATLFSLLLALPLGFSLGFYNFPGKNILKTLANSLLAIPTVTIGLLIYLLLANDGWLGNLHLLFSLSAIIIGQTLLALPIMIVMIADACEIIENNLRETLLTLGANSWQMFLTILHESRLAILAAMIMAYSRVASEIGIAMMLGGNIKFFTRTMTTAIALETMQGNFALGIALGIILLGFALGANIIATIMQRKL